MAAGDSRGLIVSVEVINTKEPSFYTELNISFPASLTIKHMRTGLEESVCNKLELEYSENHVFVCEIGNPLLVDSIGTVSFDIDTRDVIETDNLVITSYVTTWSYEAPDRLLNNMDTLELPVIYDAQLMAKR